MYCTLIIEVWLKLNIQFDCRYLELWNACIISLVFIVLDVRSGTESKYHSIVFLSIYGICFFLHTRLEFSLFLPIWENSLSHTYTSIALDTRLLAQPYQPIQVELSSPAIQNSSRGLIHWNILFLHRVSPYKMASASNFRTSLCSNNVKEAFNVFANKRISEMISQGRFVCWGW